MYDAIVIGSGIGGLTTAGLLAAVAGQRVLVLEKHTTPGGQTHAFRRDGTTWDVGLHYMGDLEDGGKARAFFDFLSGGKLSWNRMPEWYDRFVYPDVDFSVPDGEKAYIKKLISVFPDEAAAIRAWFRDLQLTRRWVQLGFVRGMMPAKISEKMGRLQHKTEALGTRTTAEQLNRRIRDPKLRAVLASQWGDYGLPPTESSLAIHSVIATHYLEGGWFPDGGSQRIARTFEHVIERAGGAVRVAQEVVEIVTENNRAVGVRVVDRRGPEPVERTFNAPMVISSVGAWLTYNTLLPTTGPIGELTRESRMRLEALGRGHSSVALYLKLDRDPRELGVTGGNLWLFRNYDHDIEGIGAALLAGRADTAFVSFPSVKAGTTGNTVEILCPADARHFDAWRDTSSGNRGADYLALKRRLQDALLDLADEHVPGLRDAVVYAELATPLSGEDFTSHPDGAFFGIPCTPERFKQEPFGPITPIPGLLLSGQDVMCLGIMGALMGGVAAASQALGPAGFPRIQKALAAGPCPAHGAVPMPEGRCWARLTERREVGEDLFELVFDLDGTPGPWAPGQFARLKVAEFEWRDYSIVDLDDNRLRLLVDTSGSGSGTRFLRQIAVGERCQAEVPLGTPIAPSDGARRIFVATGTGIAPFLPELREGDTLIYGCRNAARDLTWLVSTEGVKIVPCISREDDEGAFRGRVTDFLSTYEFAPQTPFNLCGSAAMIADVRELLLTRGATNVACEAF